MISENTIKNYCCEDISKIENYEKAIADTSQTWECHHRLELVKTGAVVDSTMQDLIDWGIYYNRPADELIFLTAKEHKSLHGKLQKGKTLAEEHKAALRGVHKKVTPKMLEAKRESYLIRKERLRDPVVQQHAKTVRKLMSEIYHKDYKDKMNWNEFQKYYRTNIKRTTLSLPSSCGTSLL